MAEVCAKLLYLLDLNLYQQQCFGSSIFIIFMSKTARQDFSVEVTVILFQLWALLHFIMPTLFDSHDEFNEWFSKDIESSAEKGSTMDQSMCHLTPPLCGAYSFFLT